LGYIYDIIKDKVKEKANFDLDEIDTEKAVKKLTIPIIFITSKQDTLIKSDNIEKLYEKYWG